MLSMMIHTVKQAVGIRDHAPRQRMQDGFLRSDASRLETGTATPAHVARLTAAVMQRASDPFHAMRAG